MPEVLHLSFAKVTFPPTLTAWAQAYTRGSFFAVASLAIREPIETIDLNALGKEIFTTLETEFFTLEKKDLQSIRQAITTSLEHLPQTVQVSFTATFVKDYILYVFIAGGGTIALKRSIHFATILTYPQENHDISVHTASGYLKASDTIFLETASFAMHLPPERLLPFSDSLPNEIADNISSQLQNTSDSTTASIIIRVANKLISPLDTPLPTSQDVESDTVLPEEQMSQSTHVTQRQNTSLPPLVAQIFKQIHNSFQLLPKRLPVISLPFLQSLSPKRKIAIGVVILVLLILIMTIFSMKQDQQTQNNKVVFAKYYSSAEASYKNATGIISMNKAGAQTELEHSQRNLMLALQLVSSGSPEAIQLDDLLLKVNDQLKQVANAQNVTVNQAALSDSPLLHVIEQNTDARFAITDSANTYFITDKGIYSVSKNTPLVTNSSDWQQLGGFGTYLNNFYVLDKQKGIIKYVADTYTKAAYFASGVSPDLSKATSLAIDGSIYILFTDGTITKFTKGQPDTFLIKGLDKPFVNPTQIVTTIDMKNLYILDSGNNRIVVLGKDATFLTQYVSSQLGSAKTIDVHETDKKIFFLSNHSVFSLSTN